MLFPRSTKLPIVRNLGLQEDLAQSLVIQTFISKAHDVAMKDLATLTMLVGVHGEVFFPIPNGFSDDVVAKVMARIPVELPTFWTVNVAFKVSCFLDARLAAGSDWTIESF